jgi:PAS domain-containing protein
MFESPEHSLRELVQFSPLAIEELDPEGKVKLWNPAAEQMSRLAKNVAQTMERDQRGSLNGPR